MTYPVFCTLPFSSPGVQKKLVLTQPSNNLFYNIFADSHIIFGVVLDGKRETEIIPQRRFSVGF
jgi:hypothetical protein